MRSLEPSQMHQQLRVAPACCRRSRRPATARRSLLLAAPRQTWRLDEKSGGRERPARGCFLEAPRQRTTGRTDGALCSWHNPRSLHEFLWVPPARRRPATCAPACPRALPTLRRPRTHLFIHDRSVGRTTWTMCTRLVLDHFFASTRTRSAPAQYWTARAPAESQTMLGPPNTSRKPAQAFFV